MITTIRSNYQPTHENLDTIIQYLNYNNVKRIIFFATNYEIDSSYGKEDGPDSNFPLLWALAEFKILGIDSLYIIFDGIFLTAVRQARMNEIKILFDEAVQHNNVFFSTRRVRFTSSLPADEAKNEFLKLEASFIQLNSSTAFDFKNMLSTCWD